MRIYNTLTGRTEELRSEEEDRIKIYVCGITPYDYSHVGHARAVVVFDAIVRYFKFLGKEVIYVRNFTDIDDKIIKRSKDEGVQWFEISEKFIEAFKRDVEFLGTVRPTFEPRVSEHINDIISLVDRLIKNGYAYKVEGNVYFNVSRFKGYGKLSKRSPDEMMAGARVEIDHRKNSPLDFALWKAAKDGEPSWDSPWGKGRPGWHIECSAMSMRYLGETLDIHGGGIDLIFPHHENEIAQSEAATGKQFARYWIHNGVVTINQEKMSKSLGNIYNLSTALERFDPEAFRLFILSSHYRSPIDFSEKGLRETERALERYYTNLHLLTQGGKDRVVKEEKAVLGAKLLDKFVEFMDDDFNTPEVIASVFASMRALNHNHDMLKETLNSIKKISEVLGVFSSDPVSYLTRLRKRRCQLLRIDENEIEKVIALRDELRKHRKFTEADAIRNQLKEQSIILEDTPKGTIWRVEL